MTDIKRNAQALMDEVQKEHPNCDPYTAALLALDRAIEQHEAFRQEVSRVMTYIKALYPTLPRNFNRFIIPAPKPDPLVEILEGLDGEWTPEDYVKEIRAALDALGFEIRSKSDD